MIHPKSPLKPTANKMLTADIAMKKVSISGAPGALEKLCCIEENIANWRTRPPRFQMMPRTIRPTKISRAQFLRLSRPIEEASVTAETSRNAKKKNWK